MNINLILLTS